MQFDDKGDLISKYPINTTNDVIQTKDYGFFSSEGLHAIKLKPDGTQEWNQVLPSPDQGIFAWVDGLAETVDGGFFILYDTMVFSVI